MLICGCCLAYLLFVLGHTDVLPRAQTLSVASIAAVSAFIAGLLQWVGLPVDETTPTKKPGKKHSTSGARK